MAESVLEELQRKLDGATSALYEVEQYLEKYNNEKKLLEERIGDLRIARDALVKSISTEYETDWLLGK